MREAAKKKADQHILIHIEGKDCVALEVKYHTQCYKKYTGCVTYTEKSESDAQNDTKFERSYSIFSEEFVMTKIIKGQEIYDMKRVKEEFDKTVARVENLDASSYKTFRLKRRLKKTFPQLVFHSPKTRSRSDIVFAECLDRGKVAETFMSQEHLSDSEEESTDDKDHETERNALPINHRSSLKEMYFSALSLREIFRELIGTPHGHQLQLISTLLM